VAVTSQDLELMRAGYALWNDGDIDGMAERCLADDVEFYPTPEWPGPHVYRGAEAVATFLRDEVAVVIGLSEIEITRETVVGDEVVFALRTVVAGEQSGLHFEVPVYHVAKVQDGRVKRIRAFLDEAQAMRVAGGGR
jgi:ketosteroid isomerase-like protein